MFNEKQLKEAEQFQQSDDADVINLTLPLITVLIIVRCK